MDPIVDVHSHIFNAEDLPIDGFIRRLSPLPGFVTAVVSKPLDLLAQWRAPGSKEKETLLRLVGGGGLEAAGVEAPTRAEVEEEVTDEEILELMREACSERGLLMAEGLESTKAAEPADLDAIGRALGQLPEAERAELERWAAEYGDLPPPEEGLEGLFDPLTGFARRVFGGIKRYVGALRLMMRHRFEIAGRLARTYEDVQLYVPTLVDFTVPAGDAPSTRVHEQIEIHSLLAKLSIAGGLPGAPNARVHPFVAFDPYREVRETALREWDPDAGGPNPYRPYAPDQPYHRALTFNPARVPPLVPPQGPWESSTLDLSHVKGALHLVRQAIERGGFVGVKIYPPAGFLPLGNVYRFVDGSGARLDAALRALYAYCEAMDVPILAHANDSNEFDEGYGRFAGPDGWELVLQQFPNLRICFGHFGHLTGVDAENPGEPAPDSWPWRFLEMIDRYPNVYADVGNSRFPVDEEYRDRFLAMLEAMFVRPNSQAGRRVMYGSDWWMNTMAPKHDEYLASFREHFGERFSEGLVRDFMGRNALRYLGFNGADDEPDFGNRNRQRLEAFYGDRPRPGWLPAQA